MQHRWTGRVTLNTGGFNTSYKIDLGGQVGLPPILEVLVHRSTGRITLNLGGFSTLYKIDIGGQVGLNL